MEDKIRFVCQSCGKTLWLQPQVYIAYAGQTECLDCRRKVTIDKTSWQAGYDAGLNGENSICRQKYDGYSWLSGYIEGKEKREESQ